MRSAGSERWDRIFRQAEAGKPKYDGWLDKHIEQLACTENIPIIDLGCGAGGDTIYLAERGYRVIACDYSSEALASVARHVPDAQTVRLDLAEPLPFAEQSAWVIVADLSLHYFPWAETVRIIGNIQRILKPGGFFLGRFNSVNDVLYGAGQGRQIEPNYYDTDEGTKRFFDEPSLSELFAGWTQVYLKEADMFRYSKRKVLWEAAYQKRF